MGSQYQQTGPPALLPITPDFLSVYTLGMRARAGHGHPGRPKNYATGDDKSKDDRYCVVILDCRII